jgi:hypothetical protein
MVLTFEQYTTPTLYHGSSVEHDFTTNGYLGYYTFFSTSKHEASMYGKYLYKVLIESDLKLFDTSNIDDVNKLLEEYGELNDPYYEEDEDEYIISSSEMFINLSDNWSIIEGAIDYFNDYDGIWIYEGGVRNLLLFSPLTEKLISVELIKSL